MSLIYNIPIIGKWILKKIVVKLENGAQNSSSLRKYVNEKCKVNVGMYTYGSCFAEDFNTGGKVEIGRYCSFGPNVKYFGANHPMEYASMSPFFYNPAFGFDVHDVKRHQLSIGNDVWVGANVTITCSCESIGNGAVIAAGAVITGNIPPYAIAGGVPAKVLKYRFDENCIKILEKSQWWELSPDELIKYYGFIDSPLKWADEILRDMQKRKFEERLDNG